VVHAQQVPCEPADINMVTNFAGSKMNNQADRLSFDTEVVAKVSVINGEAN